MRQYESDSKAMSYSYCFGNSFTLNQVMISMCYFSKVNWLFLCSSEIFSNFRLSSIVSYKKTCSSKSFLNFRLSSARLLIKWLLIKENV